jgi:sec1 family domain-containing protein 1
MATIQAAQTASLLSLLNLSNASTRSTTHSDSRAPSPSQGPPVWKILVLDDVSKDVLATVLRVQDLRDVGVTLHVFVPFQALLHLLG